MQSHLFFHSLSVVQYTCLYGEAGVVTQHHTCHVCGVLVQQDPLYLSTHLLTHGLSLTSYTDLHMGGQEVTDLHMGGQEVEAEIVSTVSSTSKSSPCLGENVRKSMDNISEGSNSSHLQEAENTKSNKIKGVELIEPDEVSNEGDDEDSSYEEMLHMPEPLIEIQENDIIM